jgi:hypothetical protein
MDVKKYYNIKYMNGNYLNSIRVLNKRVLLSSSNDRKDALVYTEEECNEILSHCSSKRIVCYPVLTAKRIDSLHIRISYENE